MKASSDGSIMNSKDLGASACGLMYLCSNFQFGVMSTYAEMCGAIDPSPIAYAAELETNPMDKGSRVSNPRGHR